jgi:hypothetical protein
MHSGATVHLELKTTLFRFNTNFTLLKIYILQVKLFFLKLKNKLK